VKKRAALGILRNFFGAQNARPYMVRRLCALIKHRLWRSVPKRRFCSRACPQNGVSYFQKKGFRVFGTVFGAMGAGACPQNGVSYFQKKGFRVFGTVFGAMGAGGMSPKRGNSFSENKVGRFQGVRSIAVRPIVAFIVVKPCPCIVVCFVRCFLPSGDSVCCGECNLSAKREYH